MFLIMLFLNWNKGLDDVILEDILVVVKVLVDESSIKEFEV